MRVLLLGSVTVTGDKMIIIVAVTVVALYILQLVFLFRGLSKKRLSNEKGLKAPMLITVANIAICSIFCKLTSMTQIIDDSVSTDTEWLGVILFSVGAMGLYLFSFLFLCLMRALRIWLGKRKRARIKRKRERHLDEY